MDPLRRLATRGLRLQGMTFARFLSVPSMIRVPFFLLFGFHKGTPKLKRAKGHYSGTLFGWLLTPLNNPTTKSSRQQALNPSS